MPLHSTELLEETILPPGSQIGGTKHEDNAGYTHPNGRLHASGEFVQTDAPDRSLPSSPHHTSEFSEQIVDP